MTKSTKHRAMHSRNRSRVTWNLWNPKGNQGFRGSHGERTTYDFFESSEALLSNWRAETLASRVVGARD